MEFAKLGKILIAKMRYECFPQLTLRADNEDILFGVLGRRIVGEYAIVAVTTDKIVVGSSASSAFTW